MLSKTRRKKVERLLLHERERALETIGRFESAPQDLRERTGELSTAPSHMADIGTEAMEQEKEFLLASVEGQRLYAIDEALRRLYRSPEAFGSCSRCGKVISWERLEVMPEAEFCASCQRSSEGEPEPA